MPPPAPGSLVTHNSKAEWGLGKVVAVDGETVHVFFLERPGNKAVAIRESIDAPRLAVAETQSHPILDNTPPFEQVGKSYELSTSRLTLDEALTSFLRQYPQGFEDPSYLGDRKEGERNYKWWAHEAFVREFGNGKAQMLLAESNAPELKKCLFAVDKVNNLLHPNWDKAPLRDGLADDEGALRYFEALFAYIDAPEPNKDLFKNLVRSLSRLQQPGSNVDSWPVTTVFPFLANPTRDIFLRPTQAQTAASLMAFDLGYQPTPNWATYSSWLTLANLMLDRLRSHGARDLIDVQSFLFVLRAP